MTAPLVAPIEARFRATGVEAVQRGMRLVGKEGDMTGQRVGGSMRQIAGGMEMIARQGKVTGESMKQIITQGAEMAFMFGAGGPIVGALAIVGVAIYEHITGKIKEAREEILKTNREIAGMANSGNSEGLMAKAREIWLGTPFDEDGNPRGPSAAKGAFRGSLADLESRMNFMKAQLKPAGFLSNDIENQGIFKAIKELTPDLEKARAAFRQVQTAIDIMQGRTNSGMQPVKIEASAGLSEEEFQRRVAAQVAFNALHPEGKMPGVGGITPGMEGVLGPKVGGEGGHTTFGLKAAEVADTFDATFVNPLGDSITKSIAEGIGGAISAGFDAAFAKGANIGSVAAAFGGVALRTMGGVFKDIGMQSLVGLEFMAAIKAAIATWNPALGIAASIGLIALGSAMQSAGSRMGGAGGGGGGGGSSATAPTTIIDRGTINPAMSAASSLMPRTTVTLQPIIIGVNDASAQRGILELVRNAERRGSV